MSEITSNSINSGFDKYCSVCQTSLSDILTDSSVGCAHCYKQFKEEIRQYLITQNYFQNITEVKND